MKRKTVTLPRCEFYDKIKDLPDEIRNSVTKAILDVFFDEKNIDYAVLDERAALILACLMPDLRRIQSQYENGKIEKKSTSNTKGLLCPNEPSQIKPTPSQVDSSILNNNIYNNIYNNQITSNQSVNNKTTPYKINCTETPNISDPEKRKFYAEVLAQHLERVVDLETQGRMGQLIKTLENTKSNFTINGESITPESILEKYLDIFRTPDDQLIQERLGNVLARVDTVKTTNKQKYLAVAMYNEANNC